MERDEDERADIGSEDLGGKARREGDDVAGAKPLGWLARAGLVARGLVYLIIGVLALKLALGDGGKATNQQGALKTIADRPFGKTLLVLVAIGLAGYALWRLIRAAVGHGAEQRDSGSDRVAALASGIAYGILCVTAVKILTDSSTGSGTPKEATGGVLGWSGGTVLVAIAGGGPHRRRRLPGVQGPREEVPRRRQDERDEPRRASRATPRSASSGTSRGRSSSR